MICLEQADRVTAGSRSSLADRFASGHGALLIRRGPSTRRDIIQFRALRVGTEPNSPTLID
jgi:hypothetical protein